MRRYASFEASKNISFYCFGKRLYRYLVHSLNESKDFDLFFTKKAEIRPAKAAKAKILKENLYFKTIVAIRAIPIKLPSCCNVFKMPEALPDFSVGAEPKMAANITVIKIPLPAAIKIKPGNIDTKYDNSGFT